MNDVVKYTATYSKLPDTPLNRSHITLSGASDNCKIAVKDGSTLTPDIFIYHCTHIGTLNFSIEAGLSSNAGGPDVGASTTAANELTLDNNTTGTSPSVVSWLPSYYNQATGSVDVQTSASSPGDELFIIVAGGDSVGASSEVRFGSVSGWTQTIDLDGVSVYQRTATGSEGASVTVPISVLTNGFRGMALYFVSGGGMVGNYAYLRNATGADDGYEMTLTNSSPGAIILNVNGGDTNGDNIDVNNLDGDFAAQGGNGDARGSYGFKLNSNADYSQGFLGFGREITSHILLELVSSSSTFAEAPSEPDAGGSVQYISQESNVCDNCTTLTVNKPSGISVGDTLYLVAAVENNQNNNVVTFTAPSGWNTETTHDGAAVFSRIADGTEATSESISHPGSYNLRGGVTYFVTRGGGEFGVSSFGQDISSTNSENDLTITPAIAGALVISAFGADNNGNGVSLENTLGTRIADLPDGDAHYSAWYMENAPASLVGQGYDWGGGREENAAILFSVEGSSEMVTRWLVDAGDTVALPLPAGYTYNFTVDWGDGSAVGTVTSDSDPDASHTYTTGGIYDVIIEGTIEAWDFENVAQSSAQHLISLGGLSDMGWKNLSGAFVGASNLLYLDAGSTGASPLTNLNKAFYELDLSSSILSGINTSSVTTFNQTFENFSTFSLDVEGWNTAAVTSMNSTFKGYTETEDDTFDLSSWDVSLVTDMTSLFENSDFLTLNLSSWDTSGSPTSTNWITGMDAGLVIYCNDSDNGGTGSSGTGTINGRACDAPPVPAITNSSVEVHGVATSLNISIPSGISSGNLLVLAFGGFSVGVVNVTGGLAGWTLENYTLHDGELESQIHIYSKVATGSESGSLTVTFDDDVLFSSSFAVLSSGSVNAISAVTAADGPMPTNSITPTVQDSLIIGGANFLQTSEGVYTRSNSSVTIEGTDSGDQEGETHYADLWSIPWSGSGSVPQNYGNVDFVGAAYIIEIAP